MPRDAFISYSHNDTDVAEAVCRALEAGGVRCWMAPRDIESGQTWPGQIVAAINDCKAFVLIYSSSSNASNQIKHEVERAGSRGMPILTFRIENVEPSPDLSYFISNAQWLDAVEPPLERQVDRLKDALTGISGGAREHQPARAPVPEPAARTATIGKMAAAAVLVLVLAGLGLWYFRSSSPLDAQGYYNRGLASYLSGNLQTAIEDWNRALELEPGSALTLRQRANAFAQAGDVARALADYNRAIELDPREPRAFYNRALLYQKTRAPAQAIADLQTALSLNPDADLTQRAKALLDELNPPQR